MPRYKVSYFIDTPNVLTDGETAAVAHDLCAAITRAPRGLVPRPVDRKVYVSREYSTAEEKEIVGRHAKADFAAGRDWNLKGSGCSCSVCEEWRKIGLNINQEGR
jgi:hypothetical protein